MRHLPTKGLTRAWLSDTLLYSTEVQNMPEDRTENIVVRVAPDLKQRMLEKSGNEPLSTRLRDLFRAWVAGLISIPAPDELPPIPPPATEAEQK